MTDIGSVAAYTPPQVAVSDPVPSPVSVPVIQDNTSPVAVPVATNANINAPATYTALANESTPNIRGANLNTSA